MKLGVCTVILLGAVAASACGGGGGGTGGEDQPPPTQAATVGATPAETAATGPVGPGQALRSHDGKLEVTAVAGPAVNVSVREVVASQPPAPGGWERVSPVYDITVTDSAGKPVGRLNEPLELRFTTRDALGAVFAWDGQSWEMAWSDAASGVVSARVEHLSQYAVLRPAVVDSAGAPQNTPATNLDAPRSALEGAVRKYSGHNVNGVVTQPYSGSAALGLPPAIASALAEAGVFGSVYGGLYGGVNVGFVSTATAGTAIGSYVLLVEPKAGFPGSGSEAQRRLVEYFPGAVGLQYAPVQEGPSAYTYQSSTAAGFVVLGIVQHKGMPLAFISTGSGLYVQPAVMVK